MSDVPMVLWGHGLNFGPRVETLGYYAGRLYETIAEISTQKRTPFKYANTY